MDKISDADFSSRVLENGKPVIVDIYADWCQPCKYIAPILTRVAASYAGRADVVKMDGETEVKTVTEYNVSSLPTLLFFKGGKLATSMTGLQSEQRIKDTLDTLL